MVNYQKGEIVKGCITGIEAYGAFVSLPDYGNGLIHISEISDSFVHNINDYFHVGDIVSVKIVDATEGENKVRLSIKNIDYKSDGHELNGAKEVGEGFKPLREHLNAWIREKTEEIKKN